VRALTSAENQKREIALRGLVADREECFAYRDTRHLRAAEVSSGFLKVHRSRGNKRGDHSISEARNKVGFENESGDATQRGRQHRRSGGISPNPDDYPRPEFRENFAGFPNGSWQVERCPQAGRKADILQRSDLNQPQRKSCSRNQAIFDSPGGTDKNHLGAILLLQLLSNGKSGNHMPARASTCQNRPHAVTINRIASSARVRRLTFEWRESKEASFLCRLLGDIQQHADAG